MKIESLLEAIHKSIAKANTDHAEWTGGWWLQAYGVEGFLVARIADGIMAMNNKPGYLTLETSFAELYDNLGCRPKGLRPRTMQDHNRIDLALYNKNDTISHIIEVKRFWSPACKNDIERLCKLYSRYATTNPLREALFVQLVLATSKAKPDTIAQKLEAKFADLEAKCQHLVEKEKLSCLFSRGTKYCPIQYTEDGSEAFSSFCLRIRQQ